MVKKTQWILLFTTFVVSICSLIFVIVAFSVDKWRSSQFCQNPCRSTLPLLIRPETDLPQVVFIECEAQFDIEHDISIRFRQGEILRKEKYFVRGKDQMRFQLTCLYEENACIYSCQTTTDRREDELRRLLAGTGLLSCPSVPRKFDAKTSKTFTQTSYNDSQNLQRQNVGTVADEVIDPGLWLTTVIFLSVTAAFSLLSAMMALVNIAFNPIEPVFSVFGLYIWNGIASGSSLMVLILWGALFGSSLSQNIAVTDTLALEFTYTSNGLAQLGLCYWFLFIPMIFHASNVGLLYWRKRIIEAEPPPPTITVDKTDLTIMLY